MPSILIVDGHAYAYRAFYAIRSLNSPAGRPTNAIYGFVKMLAKMRAKLKPSHLIVVWDGGLSRERQHALPEYKAQRPEKPSDLAQQLDEIGRYLRAANVASYTEVEVEADDYIAFIAKRAVSLGWNVVIASADKDFMQLVGPGVGLLNPNDKSETIWTADQVKAKTGVQPDQIVDWLSLLGDSVDNIPGVPGVGAKTAAKLLEQFGSVEALYARLDEVQPSRIQQALRDAKADVVRNRALVRLKPEVGSAFAADAVESRSGDVAQLAELFREWGFHSMLAELQAQGQSQPELI